MSSSSACDTDRLLEEFAGYLRREHADMTQKEKAIDRVTPPGTTAGRYQPADPLLAFLDSL